MLDKNRPIFGWISRGLAKARMGCGRVIDPGLMSCHALSLWNVLLSHVRLWGKSNKGKSQTSWGHTKEQMQTFGPWWGLAWKQKFIGLFLAVDSPFCVRLTLKWHFEIPDPYYCCYTPIPAKSNSILAVNLCLCVGF